MTVDCIVLCIVLVTTQVHSKQCNHSPQNSKLGSVTTNYTFKFEKKPSL